MELITLTTDTAYDQAMASIASSKRLVVCGSPEDQEYLQDALAAAPHTADSISSLLAESAQIDITAWFNAQHDQLEKSLSKQADGYAQLLGEWDGEAQSKQGFSLAADILTGQPHASMVGAHVDTQESWKIPAYFKYGGWNDCPDPALHCAIWQYWQEKHGAHIVAVSNDVIEAVVEFPPTTQEEAIALAMEQYLYCRDIVDQGAESVGKLASGLINHDKWFFWWD